MQIAVAGRVLLRHAPDAPFAFAGCGTATVDMYRGNFDIADYVTTRLPLAHAVQDGALVSLHPHQGAPPALVLRIERDTGGAVLHVLRADARFNRFWFRIPAEPGEHVWGCGEQMSYFDLRGRRFPLWTSEPGVGRDKTTEITFRADVEGRAGGDYWTTNYPQPSFLTSRRTAVHMETTAYAAFDFRHPDFHELEVWAAPERIELYAADSFPDLVGTLSARFGRQPALPDWLYNGAVVGLKQGVASFDRLQRYRDAGARISALWCEDWAGVRQTSFGTRLFWDWQWNPDRYPDLPDRIATLRADGIRFMGYASPYLCTDGRLFPEADALGLFARRREGGTYTVDFGEFDCGVVDFTNPEAARWFADRILRGNMLDLGMAGWMHDFGEYLPVDLALHDGSDPMLAHNAWPALWAQVGANALARAGRTGDALFFMRAGYTGVQRYCPMLWAGDQSVDFSRHDGMPSVIPGALSAGLLGNAFHHSDIGGYTSLFGNRRTPELIRRWTDMAVFTPMMRTHEGNRPGENPQVDGDAGTLAHFARATRRWCHLAPYLRHLVAEAGRHGLPAQRPLFLHHDDPACFAEQGAYLYGPDLLVAPVLRAGAEDWTVRLPSGAGWTHLWTGRRVEGTVSVPAPVGCPPVFVRDGSSFTELFRALRDT